MASFVRMGIWHNGWFKHRDIGHSPYTHDIFPRRWKPIRIGRRGVAISGTMESILVRPSLSDGHSVIGLDVGERMPDNGRNRRQPRIILALIFLLTALSTQTQLPSSFRYGANARHLQSEFYASTFNSLPAEKVHYFLYIFSMYV